MGKLKTNSRKVFCRVLPLLAALILILGSCLTVSAEESSFTMADAISYVKSKGYGVSYDYTVFIKGGDYYTLLLSDSPIYYVYWDSGNRLVTDGSNNSYFRFDSSGNKVANGTVNGWYDVYTFDGISSSILYGDNLISSIQESNFIISDENGEVVFPEPVPPILQEAAQAIVPEEVMKETIGLLPLLIPFLVGLVGFWKGLQFLSQILRKA